LKLPTEDRRLHKRAEFISDLSVLLGGFLTEQLVMGDVTTGASDDLKRCTQIAQELVTRYGMSEALGPRVFGEPEEMIFLGKEIHEKRNYSEKTAEAIDAEVDRLIHSAMDTARAILTEKRAMLDIIAKALLEKETLEKEDFEALFTKKS